MAVKAQVLEEKSRYEIIDYKEIPVTDIRPNPANPRPAFHLSDKDPELLSLGSSILTEGQHRALLVYEIVGHYQHPDEPGQYMILQGERRWRSSQLVGVDTLKANVHRVPVSVSQELELLGIEEAHKLSWQPFFEMMHAANLAQSYGVNVDHPDIANKTGLNSEQLRTAAKIFQLEPEIQAMVSAYEEEMYAQKISGYRKEKGRIRGKRNIEFTPAKAAIVYDIFLALREKMTLSVKEYSDLELQTRVATWATLGNADTDRLRQILASLNQMGSVASPGMLTTMHNMLANPETDVRNSVTSLGSSYLTRLMNHVEMLEKRNVTAEKLLARADQFGSDPALLTQLRLQLSEAIRHQERLERAIADRIKELNA